MWHSPHRRDLSWALVVVPRSLFPGLKVMGSRFPLLFFRWGRAEFTEWQQQFPKTLLWTLVLWFGWVLSPLRELDVLVPTLLFGTWYLVFWCFGWNFYFYMHSFFTMKLIRHFRTQHAEQIRYLPYLGIPVPSRAPESFIQLVHFCLSVVPGPWAQSSE